MFHSINMKIKCIIPRNKSPTKSIENPVRNVSWCFGRCWWLVFLNIWLHESIVMHSIPLKFQYVHYLCITNFLTTLNAQLNLNVSILFFCCCLFQINFFHFISLIDLYHSISIPRDFQSILFPKKISTKTSQLYLEWEDNKFNNLVGMKMCSILKIKLSKHCT